MNVLTLCLACPQALMAGHHLTLGLPKGCSWPPRFPRGALLSVGTNGARNVSIDPLRVLAWVQQSTKAMQAIRKDFVPSDSTSVDLQLEHNVKSEGAEPLLAKLPLD